MDKMKPFTEKIFEIILDKGLLALIIVYAGFKLNRILQNQKQRHLIEFEKRKNDIVFLEKQLSEFYWPIYLRLLKDNAMWQYVPQLFSKTNMPVESSDWLEKEFILKNHNEVVNIIDTKLFLAKADQEMIDELLSYVKHVAIYHTIRNTDSIKDLNPIDLKHPYPKKLFLLIETKLFQLQKEYETVQQANR